MEQEAISRFIMVLLCFFNSLYVGKKSEIIEKNDCNLLRIGMFFTVVADYFLVYTGAYNIGVFFFCIVQIVYRIRYIGAEGIRLQAGVMVGAGVIAGILTGIDPAIVLSAVYAVCIGFSAWGAVKARKKYPFPPNALIIMGMALFLLCDVTIMAYHVFFRYHANGSEVLSLAWLFYLPAQALLSSSGRRLKPEEEEEGEAE